MHISIIIPAYNEERLISSCLQSVFEAIAATRDFGFTHEVIVVDNNSTDNTAVLAKKAGARVIFEPINHIARARTAGAATATGDWFIFLDADCVLNEKLLADIFQLIKEGKHVGAGSTLLMPGLPWWAQAILNFWTMLSVLFGWAAGALMVCNAKAFREIGGFNLALYAADEIEFSQKLKKWGKTHKLKFKILSSHPLETSGRKIQLYSGREVFLQFMRLIFRPYRTLHDKKWLSIWYDGRR
jgi:glycosyltransferase involved in cell wall biosynthesis